MCLLRYVCYVPGFVGVVLSCFVTILTDFYQFFLLQVIYRLYLATSNDIPVKFERRFYFRSDRNQVVQVVTTRPVESHSRAQGDILAAPPQHSHGAPLGRKFLVSFKWCILVYFNIFERRQAPECCGAHGNLPPLPHLLDGPG